MKLAIVGTRTFEDIETAFMFIDFLRREFDIDEIVSGGAEGADRIAELYAEHHKLKITIFPAEWEKYGKAAGFRRNTDIWDYADMGISFWDGKSKGTEHSFGLAKKRQKILFTWNYEERLFMKNYTRKNNEKIFD